MYLKLLFQEIHKTQKRFISGPNLILFLWQYIVEGNVMQFSFNF